MVGDLDNPEPAELATPVSGRRGLPALGVNDRRRLRRQGDLGEHQLVVALEFLVECVNRGEGGLHLLVGLVSGPGIVDTGIMEHGQHELGHGRDPEWRISTSV
ncbi:hypothetical protein QP028_06785 [Corynebacterium suedekumii]|nr:hypothetical protein QP028_06785 [Corynebacterium suedekumii]